MMTAALGHSPAWQPNPPSLPGLVLGPPGPQGPSLLGLPPSLLPYTTIINGVPYVAVACMPSGPSPLGVSGTAPTFGAFANALPGAVPGSTPPPPPPFLGPPLAALAPKLPVASSEWAPGLALPAGDESAQSSGTGPRTPPRLRSPFSTATGAPSPESTPPPRGNGQVPVGPRRFDSGSAGPSTPGKSTESSGTSSDVNLAPGDGGQEASLAPQCQSSLKERRETLAAAPLRREGPANLAMWPCQAGNGGMPLLHHLPTLQPRCMVPGAAMPGAMWAALGYHQGATGPQHLLSPATEKEKESSVALDVHRSDPNGYTWKRYGHKRLTSQPVRRYYYACTERETHGCPARKVVNRLKVPGKSPKDAVTFSGEHTHPAPGKKGAAGLEAVRREGAGRRGGGAHPGVGNVGGAGRGRGPTLANHDGRQGEWWGLVAEDIKLEGEGGAWLSAASAGASNSGRLAGCISGAPGGFLGGAYGALKSHTTGSTCPAGSFSAQEMEVEDCGGSKALGTEPASATAVGVGDTLNAGVVPFPEADVSRLSPETWDLDVADDGMEEQCGLGDGGLLAGGTEPPPLLPPRTLQGIAGTLQETPGTLQENPGTLEDVPGTMKGEPSARVSTCARTSTAQWTWARKRLLPIGDKSGAHHNLASWPLNFGLPQTCCVPSAPAELAGEMSTRQAALGPFDWAGLAPGQKTHPATWGWHHGGMGFVTGTFPEALSPVSSDSNNDSPRADRLALPDDMLTPPRPGISAARLPPAAAVAGGRLKPRALLPLHSSPANLKFPAAPISHSPLRVPTAERRLLKRKAPGDAAAPVPMGLRFDSQEMPGEENQERSSSTNDCTPLGTDPGLVKLTGPQVTQGQHLAAEQQVGAFLCDTGEQLQNCDLDFVKLEALSAWEELASLDDELVLKDQKGTAHGHMSSEECAVPGKTPAQLEPASDREKGVPPSCAHDSRPGMSQDTAAGQPLAKGQRGPHSKAARTPADVAHLGSLVDNLAASPCQELLAKIDSYFV